MKKLSLMLSLVIIAMSCVMTFSGIPAGAVSSNIKMITTCPAENSNESMNVGFHVPLGYTNCKVQYTTQDDTSWSKAKWQTGTYETYGANSSTNPFYGKSTKSSTGSSITQQTTFLDYSVTLNDLIPDTKYMYRIYDGSAYSEVYKFKTSGAESFSMVITGDVHQYYENYGVKRAANGTKAVNAAISLASQLGAPEVSQIVSIGDVTAWGYTYNQWESLLAQPYFKEYSYFNTVGNHDAMDTNSSSTTYSGKYNAIVHNYPKNGYTQELGNCFWSLYNYVLFINVSAYDNTARAVTWAKSVCDQNKGNYKYIVLVNHVSAISKYSGNFNKTYFWNNWHEFCDQYNVDLVLTGDHHVYMRSKPIYNEAVVSNYSASNPKGTVYLTSDSADGERGSSTDVANGVKTSSILASHYYRYEISGSTADITSLLITVEADKMTTRFVYYETSKTGSSSSNFYQGSVSGHSNFYYGDTSYIYPYDHGFTGVIGPDVPGVEFSVNASYTGTVSINAAKGFVYEQDYKKLTKEGFLATVDGTNIAVRTNDGEKITANNAVVSTGCYAESRSSKGNVVQTLHVVVRGDVTGDGKFTTSDYIAIKRGLAGTYTLTGAYYQAADTDKDGTVTANDYAAIKAHFKGK